MRRFWLLLLVSVPLFAHAQAYKCKLANGKVSFQDEPCPVGAQSKVINLAVPAPPQPDAPAKASKAKAKSGPAVDKDAEAKRRRAEEEVNAQNQEAKAYNKMQRCNAARRQLGVLKQAAPAFRYDNKGDKQYIEDNKRPAEIASAEKQVAEYCN